MTDTVTFASGDNFPDALAGSILAAKLNAPILLLGNEGAQQKSYIDSKAINNLYFFGGKGVISDLLRWQLSS